ncbi:type I polyketide synthase [Nocardia sp. CA-135953]|uniref:type I polyketide synthase n=1 Tax=Nocardia sp. CA-135953 TaxID=3239978 RepID=UPI003D9800C5
METATAAGQGEYRDDIAVIGIACRLPNIRAPHEYWRLLAAGRDTVTDMPADRWYSTDPIPPELRRGSYLPDVADFDAEFFGIAPREAAVLDPQQRLALELSWAAVESAGIVPARLSGGSTGVFVGSSGSDFAALLATFGRVVTAHTSTGVSRGLIANRISYALGLHGPSLAIDSAQSSSLVAVHIACESLLSGGCDYALAGGVHLNLLPDTGLSLAQLGALSPDGRCFTFDSRANGFVRGEGGGIVLLKRLSAALRDGDPIRAVIRGSATNNDGATMGLSTPSADAQAAVLRAAYARAGVAPGQVGYVELHGTGTRIGDPIEAAALGAVLGTGRDPAAPLHIGSVKTNIGHLEGAAGILGMIKAILAIQHAAIPASLNYRTPNPRIPVAELGLRVQDRLGDWPAYDSARVAGVSSFGIGGTNCHVVLSAPPDAAAPVDHRTRRQPAAIPWVLSARSPHALREQAEQLFNAVHADPALDPGDIGWSLATTRTVFEHRAVVTADRAGALAALRSLSTGEPDESVTVAARPVSDTGVVFVFPGQGSQWRGMARELLLTSPVFAESIARCQQAFRPFVDWTLLDVLGGAAADALDRDDVLQPALFSMMVSLAAVWRSWGVEPVAVLGHSQGEIAAAYVAGMLSLDDAARVVALRSALLHRLPRGGGMLSVGLSATAMREWLDGRGGDVQIAASNGPNQVVVSGAVAVLTEVARECAEAGVRTQLLPVGYGSHSGQVDAIETPLLAALSGITPRAGTVPFYSTVEERWIDGTELGPHYWFRNVREPVRFDAAVRALVEDGRHIFLEASPHPVLVGSMQDIFADIGVPGRSAVGSLARDNGGPTRLLHSATRLFVDGAQVNWTNILAATAGPGHRIELPTYAFQGRRYWPEVGEGGLASAATHVAHVPETTVDPVPDVDDFAPLVCKQTAIVLGHRDVQAVRLDRSFKDAGLDSGTAVELVTRLNAATGLTLPTSAVFDYPSPSELALRIAALVSGSADVAPGTVLQTTEPLAIVGMGCRFAGGLGSPEQLWEAVVAGRDVVGDFPANRGWDLDRLFDPDPDAHGRSTVRKGGFLSGAGDFDATFFGISPREALSMDPQQRQILEVSWEAIESAGIDPNSLRGTDTGVFIGIYGQDYGPRLDASDAESEGYRLTGSAGSVASGRIAYFLGLEGPAISVDTACSSSLVALHHAGQSLRAGECSLALVGGVTVMASPWIFIEFSRQRGLAPDGRCKSFAAAADGVGWAEGAGMLVVERLSDARRNGHEVLALVRGSAVNSDGASNGLTAPNGPAQQRVICSALAAAGLSAADVDAVEAHGTGTTLGDPIEAQAILATYGRNRPADRPLRLGSLKSNIGHTQAAAGVAGVIKMVLAMRHGTLPRTLHVDQPSPHVDWSAGAVELLTEQLAWPATDRPRRAGISSFGISGTNAHVVIEQAPPPEPEPPRAPIPAIPWVLSARSPAALAAQAARLLEFLIAHPELEPVDVGSALTRRGTFEHRAVVTGGDRAALLEELVAVQAAAAGIVAGKTAFVFAGQGAQRLGMGRELHEAYPVFAAAWDETAAALSGHLGVSLDDVVWGSDERLLEQTRYAQTALFLIEVALYRLFESWGVTPDFVLGHSVGEIAAAHVAGVLSLADAAALVAARGRLMQSLPPGGAMVAVQARIDDVRPLVGDGVSIAAINAPNSVVISGADDAVQQVVLWLREQGFRSRDLAVSHAFHSELMEPVLDEFAQVAASLTVRAPRIPVVSNRTGAVADEDYGSAEYWVRHARDAVRFADGVRTLESAGVVRFVEIGPDAGLAALVEQTVSGDAVVALPSLRRRRAEVESVLGAVGRLFESGADVRWSALFDGTGARWVPLPTYPFLGERYWLRGVAAGLGDVTAAGLTAATHPMLGAVVPQADSGTIVLTGRLAPDMPGWLADHAVHGTVLLPGTGFLELALRAAAEVGCTLVQELTLSAPLVFPDNAARQVQVLIEAQDESGERALSIHSRGAAEEFWTVHATGTLTADAPPPVDEFTQWPPAGAVALDLDEGYPRLADWGYEYGPAFRGLTGAWHRGDDVFGEAILPESVRAEAKDFEIHPALLDAALHALLHALRMRRAGGDVLLPFVWEGVSVLLPGTPVARVLLRPCGVDAFAMTAADAAGRTVLVVRSLRLRGVAVRQLAASGTVGWLTELEWIDLGPVKRAAALPWADWSAQAEPPPPALVLDCRGFGAGSTVVTAAHAAVTRVLGVLRTWLSEPRFGSSTLVIVTSGAVDTAAPDLAAAAVWGLVRSAQSEEPGRIVLADVAEGEFDVAAILGSAEPQVIVRDGVVRAPRLKRVDIARSGAAAPTLSDGTLLITGGTGGLGALVARHAVAHWGVRRLLLTSRSGPDAAGAGELARELRDAGAAVDVVACDVADAAAVRDLIAAVPTEEPLVGVIHAAGVGANGMIGSLTSEQVDQVLAPKVDGAWHLHEATCDLDLALFVLFSSEAGVLGGPGQGNYAAANTFLDALASWRRGRGLAGQAIAWGLWEQDSRMTRRLDQADLARVRRAGLVALSAPEGLAMLDAAVGLDSAWLLAARLDTAVLREQARTGHLPPILRQLIPTVPTRPPVPRDDGLALRLRETPEQERHRVIRDVVRGEIAVVLGHAGPAVVDPAQKFEEMGFDSLSAVEVRNRLKIATGLPLSATLVFDYPTPNALATHLEQQFFSQRPERVVDDRALRAALQSVPLENFRAAGILDALLDLASAQPGAAVAPNGAAAIDEMDQEALIRHIMQPNSSS